MDVFQRKESVYTKRVFFTSKAVRARLMPYCKEMEWAPDYSSLCPGVREGSYGHFYPNTTTAVIQYHWSAEFSRVKIWSDRSPCYNHSVPRTNLYPPGGAELIMGLVRPPKRYQQPPSLEFQPSNSFNERVFYEPQLMCSFVYYIRILRYLVVGRQNYFFCWMQNLVFKYWIEFFRQ